VDKDKLIDWSDPKIASRPVMDWTKNNYFNRLESGMCNFVQCEKVLK